MHPLSPDYLNRNVMYAAVFPCKTGLAESPALLAGNVSVNPRSGDESALLEIH
jgi:hypothetical protein